MRTPARDPSLKGRIGDSRRDIHPGQGPGIGVRGDESGIQGQRGRVAGRLGGIPHALIPQSIGIGKHLRGYAATKGERIATADDLCAQFLIGQPGQRAMRGGVNAQIDVPTGCRTITSQLAGRVTEARWGRL